mgnify:CR=1 FL=1
MAWLSPEADYLLVTLLIVFIVIAFFALIWHINRMTFGPAAQTIQTAPLPWSCRLTLLLGALPVLLLGIWQPEPLHRLVQLAAISLRAP